MPTTIPPRAGSQMDYKGRQWGLRTLHDAIRHIRYQVPDATAPGQNSQPTNISINGQSLEEFEHISYFGSILSRTPAREKDVKNRISAAPSAFGRHSQRVFFNHVMTIRAMVFRAIIPCQLFFTLVNLERCTGVTSGTLNASSNSSNDRSSVFNGEITLPTTIFLHHASLPSVEAIILHWAGHVQRIGLSHFPRIMLHDEFAIVVTRPRRHPKCMGTERHQRCK